MRRHPRQGLSLSGLCQRALYENGRRNDTGRRPRMARTPSGRRTARRADRKPLPLPAQRGSDEPAGGDRDAEKRGRHGIAVRPLPPTAATQLRRDCGDSGPRARGQKGRSAGVYAARLFRRLGAHTREAARHAPGHSVYGLPERRSADIGPPLRPAAAGARRRRPHAAGRAGQRHGADGSGILRRGALLRQFAGRTARLRHAQGTRIVAARLSGRALHHPALHRRTRDRGSRIGRHMGLRRPDGAREMAPSDAERRRGRRTYGRRGIIYRAGNRFHRQDRPAQRQAVVAARLRLRAGAGASGAGRRTARIRRMGPPSLLSRCRHRRTALEVEQRQRQPLLLAGACRTPHRRRQGLHRRPGPRRDLSGSRHREAAMARQQPQIARNDRTERRRTEVLLQDDGRRAGGHRHLGGAVPRTMVHGPRLGV